MRQLNVLSERGLQANLRIMRFLPRTNLAQLGGELLWLLD